MKDYTDVALAKITNTLFRGRPYSIAVPFLKTFTGVAGEAFTLWTPDNAYFELANVYARSTVAVELMFADGNAAAPIGFMVAPTATYERIDLGMAPYRSVSHTQAQLLLVDLNGVACVVRGVVYGWEVTRDGYYR